MVIALVGFSGAVVGCTTTRPEDPGRRVDLTVPTTAPVTDCQRLAAAERAVADSSLTAVGADEATRGATRTELEGLRQLAPPSLTSAVDVVARTFDRAWAIQRTDSDGLDGRVTPDPFEDDAYLRADQSIRHRVVEICGTDPGP